ncbi:MAG: ATP-binding protein [Micrococcales bacterium]|nr:ATP-binding protein [Micrococcales bacterium]
MNPFSPAFGSQPNYLAGREAIVQAFMAGLAGGPGDPNRSTIVVGPRGSGKTALLAHIAGLAPAQGWIQAQVTALPGMLDAILEQLMTNAQELLPSAAKAKLTSVGAFGLSVSVARTQERPASWRLQTSRFLEALAATDTGLLITVDEVNAGLNELVHLVADYQHFVSEGRQVALLLAGLPGRVLQLLTHKSVSFLRRAAQHHLQPLSQADARLALRIPIENSGRTIEPAGLDAAAQFSTGFPFLVQMVGYQSWRQNPEHQTITAADVSEGIRASGESMDNMILDTTIREISPGDLSFLLAMSKDQGFSLIKDLGIRLGITPANAGQYRLRLIKQGLIEPYGRGRVRFALPLLQDYLLRHEAGLFSRATPWSVPGDD